MQEEKYRTWKKIGERTAYKGRVHIVEYEVELPNGDKTFYEVDHGTSCAVAVLIRTPDNSILLAHQYRFPLDKWIYDLPGGGKKADESIEEAVIRECREEAGIAPRKIEKLATFYPNPGRSDWPAHVFYCDDFAESKIELHDPSEYVEPVLMPISELKDKIDAGQIVDPSLLIAWHTACAKGYITV